MREMVPYNSKYILHPVKQDPTLSWFCLSTGAVMKYWGSSSAFLSGQLLSGNGVQGKTSKFQGHKPILHFPCWGIHSLSRSNAIQTARTVDKVFCESTDGGTSRSITSKESKFICRICGYSSEDKSSPSLWWKRSNIANNQQMAGWFPCKWGYSRDSVLDSVGRAGTQQ